MKCLQKIQEYFLSLDINNRKRLYYSARKLYNDIRLGKLVDRRKFDNLVSSDDKDLLHACLCAKNKSPKEHVLFAIFFF